MRFRAVHNDGTAFDNERDAALRVQRLWVWSHARTWVVRPIPESASCEIAKSAHNAHAHVVAVSMSLGCIVTIDANCRVGKTHPVVQSLWRVVLKEAAEEPRYQGKLMGRLRDNILRKCPNSDKTQHFRVHE